LLRLIAKGGAPSDKHVRFTEPLVDATSAAAPLSIAREGESRAGARAPSDRAWLLLEGWERARPISVYEVPAEKFATA
jgi:hypothetical protein